MKRVGKTLLDLQLEAEPLSVKTAAMIAIKAISALEELHSFGYLHRDIKPNNIAIAKHPSSSRLYLLDFGLSTAFPKNGVHVAYREQVPFQGTPYFCSLASLRGVRPTRRDDLEALGYVLVYLQKGYLPWFDTSLDLAAIREMRENYTIAKLCEGLEPEFAEFLLACQTIGFSDAPDYAYFHRKCVYLLQKLGHEFDWKYDWTKLLLKTSSFQHTHKSHAQRRSSLPVTQADCEEQEPNECSTPVASIHQLPAFKFPRPKSFAS
jgi:serine/threonine protein kinase